MPRRFIRSRRLSGSSVPLLSKVRTILAGGAFFTAENYTVDGVSGKVASFVDWLDPTHTLAQSTSGDQVVVPTANSVLGNQLTAAFTGTQYYASSRAASAWKYLHDGTGFDMIAVFDPRGTLLANTPYIVASTHTYSTNVNGNSLLWRTANPTPGIGMRCKNGTGAVIDAQSNTLAVSFTAIGTYLEWSYLEGGSPEYTLREKSNLETSGNSAAAPDSGNPQGTLTLASDSSAEGSNAIMNWAALLVAPRVFTATERSVIQSWILQRYGVAA